MMRTRWTYVTGSLFIQGGQDGNIITGDKQEKRKMVSSAFGEAQGGSSALFPIGLFSLITSVYSMQEVTNIFVCAVHNTIKLIQAQGKLKQAFIEVYEKLQAFIRLLAILQTPFLMLRRLIGRRASDEIIKEDMKLSPFKVATGDDDKSKLWLHTKKKRGNLLDLKAPIFVNGSLTKDFSLQRGLRQGDSISPFLFILAMEGLHVAMEDVVEHGIFLDIRVGPGEACISHLFYADDAMFMGEWDAENVSKSYNHS
uniref:RNA-directed DNA polymerase, eukaryota, reverse transcriptase zinc-binding domain protein n=1 Tax=Tanacetum cinerariifolium TaxID=118510 RepID=A0A6L2KWF7_TANCI|nr:RNA-directed DNA polymerase, eukaryota, reverse transcriptase zinc-binding domain protein [Tanacetum cinerariifolium]